MIKDNFETTGELSIVLRDANGNIKEQRHVPNLVVTSGKKFVAQRMKDASTAVMSHMAVGEGNSAPAAGQTALDSEVGRASLISTVVTDNVVTYTCTFGQGVGTGALTEAGIFNNSSAGNMLSRTTFFVVNKDSVDTLTIVWQITAA